MGVPSINVSKNLVRKLGVSLNNVSYIWYSGDGWTGKAVIYDKKNKMYSMEYTDACMKF